MNARGISMEQAVIEVAEAVNLMDGGTAAWLRRELGLGGPPSSPAADQPHWDADNGRLSFGGIEIRRVRIFRDPTNIQVILNDFEAAGWPTRIDNPLEVDQQKLHQALRSLNRGLVMIRFRAQEGAQAIVWERV